MKFTWGEEKLEELLKLSKSFGDKTGLGYNKKNDRGLKNQTTFVKGNSPQLF